MAEEIAMKVIARIHTDFPEKFGIPRQSGLIEELKSTIVFEPEFRDANALRGLEEYSHLWLIWEFSEAVRDTWSPMVRPPRLGGNKRVGVFATRSPFRPNPIGLSSVKLEYVEQHPSLGPVLHLTGADLMDGTPILDIKPYLPHVDSHVEALGTHTFIGSFPDFFHTIIRLEQITLQICQNDRTLLRCRNTILCTLSRFQFIYKHCI